MKKTIFVAGVFILSSCLKEANKPSDDGGLSSKNASSHAETLLPARTNFGTMIVGDFDIPQKIDVTKSLAVNYIRYTITMSEWTGKDNGFERFTGEGFHIVCNINALPQPDGDQPPVPFIRDTITYKKKLTAILNKYQPDLVAIENEETNQSYHVGAMSQYITQLKAASTVIHSKGLKMTDGGIHPQGICYFVWKDYKDRGMDSAADNWMNLTFNSGMRYAALHPEDYDNSFNYYWRQIDTLLNAFSTMKIDYVNAHIYDPINNVDTYKQTIPVCLPAMQDYIKRRTGKQLISNECGQHNQDPKIVSTMLQAFSAGKYPYSIWFSGDTDNGVRALQNPTGGLRKNGISYKTYVSIYDLQ
jgi:hypothetical protein